MKKNMDKTTETKAERNRKNKENVKKTKIIQDGKDKNVRKDEKIREKKMEQRGCVWWCCDHLAKVADDKKRINQAQRHL